jgi:hypothetical protein
MSSMDELGKCVNGYFMDRIYNNPCAARAQRGAPCSFQNFGKFLFDS